MFLQELRWLLRVDVTIADPFTKRVVLYLIVAVVYADDKVRFL